MIRGMWADNRPTHLYQVPCAFCTKMFISNLSLSADSMEADNSFL